MGRRGVFLLFKLFLSAFAKKGGGSQHPVGCNGRFWGLLLGKAAEQGETILRDFNMVSCK